MDTHTQTHTRTIYTKKVSSYPMNLITHDQTGWPLLLEKKIVMTFSSELKKERETGERRKLKE